MGARACMTAAAAAAAAAEPGAFINLPPDGPDGLGQAEWFLVLVIAPSRRWSFGEISHRLLQPGNLVAKFHQAFATLSHKWEGNLR